MRLFLYYKFFFREEEKICSDFAIFMGNHLDGKSNSNFKMDNVLFSMSGDLKSGEILRFINFNLTERVIELDKMKGTFRKILRLTFGEK